MNKQTAATDPDDYFSHTRMSFGDHIEDLRLHLFRAIGGFLIGMIACFFIGHIILDYIAQPVVQELGHYYDKRRDKMKEKMMNDPDFLEKIKPVAADQLVKGDKLLAAMKKLGFEPQNPEAAKQAADEWIPLVIQVKPADTVALIDIFQKELGQRPTLKVLRVEEGFMVWMKVCFVAGLILSSPWVFYQIWAFIAAGLFPHEKRLVHWYLPFAIVLFLGGVVFAQIVVIPQAVSYLLMFTDWLGFEPDLRLTEWLNFAILVPLVFGIAFQTPLVMLMLERLGIVTIASYQKVRRYAAFALTVIAALIAPGDLTTMIIMVGSLLLFYELGILLCRLMPKRPWDDLDVPDPDEMVEV